MDQNTDSQQDPQTVKVETKAVSHASPKRVGPYLVQELLGKGAMGEVFVGFHEKLKRKVALKVLPEFFTQSPNRVERFTREMAAVGRLDHPNVVRATDAGEDAGCHYIAMEYVEGLDLQQLIGEGRTLDVSAACEIIRQAAMGLQHIRENDLVHRDIKPSNLMVTRDGVVKILDLGIARLRSDDEMGTLTAEGGLMGTPDFIAPEQVTDCGCVDIRADIYSLGCTLYRLLAGNAPFDGPEFGTNMAKVIAHTQSTPKCISLIVPDLPADLVKTIRQMMARDPKARYQEPNQVVAAMCKWADASSLPELVARRSGDTVSLSSRTQRASLKAERVQKKSFFSKLPRAAVVVIPLLLGLCAVVGARRIRARFQDDGVEFVESKISKVSHEATTTPHTLSPSDASLPPNDHQQTSSVTTQERLQGTRDPLEEIARNSGATANATAEINSAVRNIDESTSEISKTLQTLETSVRRLADQPATVKDQLITDPQSDGEIYHNAKTFARLGRSTDARNSYLKLLRKGCPFVDVHASFQEFAIGQLGLSGTRRAYSRYVSNRNAASDLAVSLLHDPEQKRSRLQMLVKKFPDFAPAYYELSKTLRDDEDRTLADAKRERELLNDVKRLHEEGHFLLHYLDKSEAGRVLREVGQRQKELAAEETLVPIFGRTVQTSRSTGVNLFVAEPCLEIKYSTDGVEYRSTGKSIMPDPKRGVPLAKKSLILPRTTSNELLVKYVDLDGVERGPFKVSLARVKGPLDRIAAKKSFLQSRQETWLRLGPKAHLDIASFKGLKPHAGIIALVHYGIDVDRPNQILPVSAVMGDATIPLDSDAEFAVVRLEYTDGTQSEVVRFDRK